MIKIENVSYQYKAKEPVLEQINLTIQEGEFITIVGKNGSGKSTLGKLISGLYKPKSGKIEIDDIDTSKKENFLSIREKIGIIFQNPENQILFDKVKDEMMFSMQNLGKDKIETRIEEALKITGMEEYKEKNCYELSLGQKQRIAIAEVLSIGTKYIVFDEPTTMLDSKGKQDVYELVKRLKKEGYTILYITNFAEEILLSDRILIMNNHKIETMIEKKEIMNHLEILEEYEVKIPTILKIVKELEKEDIAIKLEEYTEEELIQKIKDIIKKRKESF